MFKAPNRNKGRVFYPASLIPNHKMWDRGERECGAQNQTPHFEVHVITSVTTELTTLVTTQ